MPRKIEPSRYPDENITLGKSFPLTAVKRLMKLWSKADKLHLNLNCKQNLSCVAVLVIQSARVTDKESCVNVPIV